MNQDLLNILVHPIHKTKLFFDTFSGKISDKNGTGQFSVKENVPILLINEEEVSLTSTEQHAKAGSTFHYKEHYQLDAETYDYFKNETNKLEKEEHRRLHQMILAQIPADTGWILDVGCGGGWLAAALTPKQRRVISMDISDINPIKALLNTNNPYHFGLVADVFEMPIGENSIDCIVASEIIEHVSYPKRFLEELFKVLKPGGRLIVTTPYNEKILQSLCIHCNHLTPHNAHLHSFTENSIKMIVPAGARQIKTLIFNNKILVRSGLQNLMRILPLGIYSALENITNKITGKRAYRLMLVFEK